MILPEARGLDPDKLERGLGISQMAIVDANQDPACTGSKRLFESYATKINFLLKMLVDYTLQQNHL